MGTTTRTPQYRYHLTFESAVNPATMWTVTYETEGEAEHAMMTAARTGSHRIDATTMVRMADVSVAWIEHTEDHS